MGKDSTSQGIGGDQCIDRKNCTLLELFQESCRVNRFITKLFNEALSLEADQISFIHSADGVSISLKRGEVERKILPIARGWFEPIALWLRERSVPFFAPLPGVGTGDASVKERCTVAQRAGDQVIACCFERRIDFNRKGVIALTQLQRYRYQRWLDQFGFRSGARKEIESIISGETGVIVVAAPAPGQLQESLAAILSVSGFNHAAAVGTTGLNEVLEKSSGTMPVIVSLQSDDAVDALLKFRSSGVDLAKCCLRGVICQGFVKAVCRSCARKSFPDKKLIEILPEALRVGADNTYMVGRGCDECGQSGYRGVSGVHSLAAGSEALIQLLQKGAQEDDLLAHLYPRGTRSLLEDGVRKVCEGAITFEALYELCQVARPVYLKYLRRTGTGAEDERIALSDDYFRAEAGVEGQSAPLRGTSVFRSGAEAGGADDSPLFSVGASGKVRDKPLLLVVEDDPDQREILFMVLKSAQYEVKLVSDGVEAITYLNEDLPDLIISDLMMPRMDGSELITKLKAHHLYKNIPVLILTVIADADREFTLLDLGADDYCEKSIQRKVLLKRIEKLLQRPRTPR